MNCIKTIKNSLIGGGRSGIKAVNLATKAERGFFFLQWSKDGLPRGTGVSLWLKEASKNNCKLWAITMTITRQQLHTLRLLRKEPACQVYRTHRAEYYTWIHKDAQKPITTILHRLFSSGYATLSSNDRNMAVLTDKGRAVVTTLGSC